MARLHILLVIVLFSGLALGVSACGADRPAAPAAAGAQPEVRFSGPFVHKNAAVFLVHGPDKLKDKEFLTLKEALDSKQAEVIETSTVSELTIINRSRITVYIPGGIIVKGGKQDRVIPNDYICPPGAELKVSSFCVEQGRWSGRGNESAARFTSSENLLATKELKMAAREAHEQGKVWEEVANTQSKLSANAGKDVRSEVSASSLQLALEDKQVQAAAAEYEQALRRLTAGKDKGDVVGYVLVVNGKINNVDIYGCHSLFAKLWPQLLNSAAIEAVAKFEQDKKYDAPTVAAVEDFLKRSRAGQAERKQLAGDNVQYQNSTKDSVLFYTKASAAPNAPSVRENALNRE